MKIQDVLRIGALFLAILLSGGHVYYPRITLIALFALLMLLNRLGTGWRISSQLTKPALLVGVVMIIELLRPATEPEQWITRLVNFSAGLALLNMYVTLGKDRLHRDLFAVVRYMPYQAIGTVALALISKDLFTPIGMADPVGGETGWTFLYLFNFHGLGALGLVRPDGLFWEPGVFQIFLGLNLIICLWSRQSYYTIITAIGAILLTQSTTGLIGLCLILAYYVFDTAWRRGARRGFWPAILVGALLIPATSIASGNLEDKITGDQRGSYYARSYDTLAGLNIVWNHPITGIGFSLDEYLIESRIDTVALKEYSESAFEERQGNSNGIVTLLYSMGIPIALLFILGILRQNLLDPSPVIVIILTISLLSEPLTLFPFFLMLALSGWAGHIPRLVDESP